MNIKNDIFYILTVDNTKSAYSSQWDAIKGLRDTLKADIALIPGNIELVSVDISDAKTGYTVKKYPLETLARGLLWADADFPKA